MPVLGSSISIGRVARSCAMMLAHMERRRSRVTIRIPLRPLGIVVVVSGGRLLVVGRGIVVVVIIPVGIILILSVGAIGCHRTLVLILILVLILVLIVVVMVVMTMGPHTHLIIGGVGMVGRGGTICIRAGGAGGARCGGAGVVAGARC
jgi:hypothetical protein